MAESVGVLLLLLSCGTASARVHAMRTAPRAVRSRVAMSVSSESHWLDFLKFGGTTPTFDVVAKTQE
eukprot:CAMPEP_0185552442 /NCGR_PEP_ID=MMETSP1381-20130426/33572_1 /TAXON_ID=298111 /ORGANISM="Pavlova sp., Strain CCMP459" /LENGTH=66 /DNA_ID=CAMNT_0028165427 /DNA_START=11 /DNA_END=208 /DNA_ORIENTATION=+